MRKAYYVSDGDEISEIVFAETRAKAIYKSETLAWVGDWTAMRAKRIKWADVYAEVGEVPLQAMLDHGWWLECEVCHAQTNEIVLVKDDSSIKYGVEIRCAECAKGSDEDGEVSQTSCCD